MHRVYVRLSLAIVLWASPVIAQSPNAANDLSAKMPLPTAADLADRCAKASGGAGAWAKLSTLVLQGTIEMPSLHITGKVELYEKAPNRSLRVISVAERQYVHKHGFDGEVGWELGPPTGLRRLVAGDLEQAKLEAIFDSDVRLRELYPDMKVLGKSKIGDRDAYVALMRTRPSAKAARFYFDAETGLRVAEESDVLASSGQFEKTTTFYEDFRPVGGVKIPFRVRFTSPSINFTITIEDAHANVAVDDAVFRIPTAPQASSASAPAQGSVEGPDEGQIEGNLYKNGFFGLAYQFPEGWTPHGEKTKKHIMEIGKSAVSGDTNLEKGAYLDAEKRTVVLLSVFKYPLGTPVDDNDGIQVMSEDVSFAPGIKSGKEYLQLMARNLRAAKMPVELQRDPEEVSLAGQTFYRQNIILTVRSKQVYETIMATVLKEHALVFILVGSSDDGRTALAKTLETVHFDTPRSQATSSLKVDSSVP
jgi:hypothetical protein